MWIKKLPNVTDVQKGPPLNAILIESNPVKIFKTESSRINFNVLLSSMCDVVFTTVSQSNFGISAALPALFHS
jgi:hypothetical protein